MKSEDSSQFYIGKQADLSVYSKQIVEGLFSFATYIYCAAYQRSAICDEFGESAGCSVLTG